jgi:hypothetical protein
MGPPGRMERGAGMRLSLQHAEYVRILEKDQRLYTGASHAHDYDKLPRIWSMFSTSLRERAMAADDTTQPKEAC